MATALIESVGRVPGRNTRGAAAFYLTFASAVAILVSISVSQLLMAFALAALLLSSDPLRVPPVKLPLAVFITLTFVAVFLSPSPAAALPQIRKLYVFVMLLLVYSTFRSLRQISALVLAWAAAASLSAVRGLGQFLDRRHEALLENANTYGFYLDDRITGFASHWMTFGGELMIVLLMLAAVLLFARGRAVRIAAAVFLPLLWVALVLNLTRSIFLLGVPVGVAWLLWRWKPRVLLALPVLAAAGFFTAPFQVRERILSVVHPHGEVDSNSHREVTRRTGWEMVKAHPWFGLGPEQTGPQFDRYVPADIHRPLPRGWYGHLHNIYLQYAAERGIPALAAMLWFIGKALRDFHRASRVCSREALFVLRGAEAAILAVLAEGFFEYNLGDSEVLTVFFAVIAAGYVAAESCA